MIIWKIKEPYNGKRKDQSTALIHCTDSYKITADIAFWVKALLVAAFMVWMTSRHGELHHCVIRSILNTIKQLVMMSTKKLPHSHILVDYRHGNENTLDDKQLLHNSENAHSQSLCDTLRMPCRQKYMSHYKKVCMSSAASFCYNRDKSHTQFLDLDSIGKFTLQQPNPSRLSMLQPLY